MTFLLLGPVSSATPNGQGPLFSWFLILVGIYVAGSSWRFYLKRRNDTDVPIGNLVGVSAVSLALVAAGVWELFRR